MSDAQKLREQAWKVMKDLHDGPKDTLIAASGWCAPSRALYSCDMLKEAFSV